MPVTKSAAKALRRDQRRTTINLRVKRAYKEAVRAVRRNPTAEALQKAHSQLDRAAKKKIIHKNKAARLKSRLSKLLKSQPSLPSEPSKKTRRKKAQKTRSTKVPEKTSPRKTHRV